MIYYHVKNNTLKSDKKYEAIITELSHDYKLATNENLFLKQQIEHLTDMINCHILHKNDLKLHIDILKSHNKDLVSIADMTSEIALNTIQNIVNNHSPNSTKLLKPEEYQKIEYDVN